MSLWSTHELSTWEYPFQCMRYCNFPRPHLVLLASVINSISYSSSPSLMIDRGLARGGPYASISLYGRRRSVWNTLWILMFEGRLSWNVTAEICFIILKGLSWVWPHVYLVLNYSFFTSPHLLVTSPLKHFSIIWFYLLPFLCSVTHTIHMTQSWMLLGSLHCISI